MVPLKFLLLSIVKPASVALKPVNSVANKGEVFGSKNLTVSSAPVLVILNPSGTIGDCGIASKTFFVVVESAGSPGT